MPKYLIQASYTAEGLKGLQKDKASGRRTAVASAVETLGGKLEATYYTWRRRRDRHRRPAGQYRCVFALVGGVGLRSRANQTTPLLTVEEVDKALAKNINYRAPGR